MELRDDVRRNINGFCLKDGLGIDRDLVEKKSSHVHTSGNCVGDNLIIIQITIVRGCCISIPPLNVYTNPSRLLLSSVVRIPVLLATCSQWSDHGQADGD